MPLRMLELDRDKANPLFDSWKLDRSLQLSQAVQSLDGSVKVSDHSTDYLNTRAAILHNHLHGVSGDFFVFQNENGCWSLHRLTSQSEAPLDRAWGRAV